MPAYKSIKIQLVRINPAFRLSPISPALVIEIDVDLTYILTQRLRMPIYLTGAYFTIEHTAEAETSRAAAEGAVPGNKGACIQQLRALIQRFADTTPGRIFNKDRFRDEGDQVYAFKARCGLRAYGWYSNRRGVFVIAHYVLKAKQKLDPADLGEVLRQRMRDEEW